MAIKSSVIEELISYLLDTVADIEQFEVDQKMLETNKERSAAVKYMVQTAVEACANIAEHIIFGLHLGNPVTSKELFPILAEHNIISHDLSDKLKDAVGLRNILVHLYRQVNLSILADSATVGLDDLRAFAKVINEFLEKQRP